MSHTSCIHLSNYSHPSERLRSGGAGTAGGELDVIAPGFKIWN